MDPTAATVSGWEAKALGGARIGLFMGREVQEGVGEWDLNHRELRAGGRPRPITPKW